MAIVLGVVITAMLVADAGVVLARSGDNDSGGDAAPAPEPKLAEQVPDKLQPVLPELEAFVEQARGLQFQKPPVVALLPDDQFEKMLRGDAKSSGESKNPADSEEVQTTLGELRALGLVEGNVDVNGVLDTQTSQTIGFYDYKAKKLFVRGGDATPDAEQTLVHELTHALDDQHFDLDRPHLETSEQADAFDAWQALVEGDAVTVERQWHDSRPPEEQDAIDAAEGVGDGSGGAADSPPDFFAEVMAFPYQVGPRFVAAVRATRGQGGLDEAFRHPPTTTEQVLEPKHFLAADGARHVDTPAADGKVTDTSVLGELGLILITERAVSQSAAANASKGWGGDSFQAWGEGSQTCVRANIVMDTPGDTAELVDVLHTWADKHPGATVTGTDPIVIKNCG